MKYELQTGHKVDLKELSNIGQVMTVGDFLQNIILGNFIDYDGYARFIIEKDNKLYEITNATYSIHFDNVYINDKRVSGIFEFVNFCHISKIVWYNR